MKRKKILERIAGWLDNDEGKQRDHREELEELLAKLEKKKIELNVKLKHEKSKRKRKQLSIELKVVNVQLEKGMNVLDNLNEA